MGSSQLQKRLLIAGALVVVLGVGLFVYVGLSTWDRVNRVEIERLDSPQGERPVSVEGVSEDNDEGSAAPDEDEARSVPTPSRDADETDIFLLVGSDSRAELAEVDGFGAIEGARADVMMLVMRSHGDTAILSLPRDLWVESACDGEMTRLNSEVEGCGELLNGPSLLIRTIEGLIDETIDHFAMVDLAGFQESVDVIGGYEICLERPVRDARANLELPEGCTMASGEQTLAWLRSRHTQELTDQGWRIVPGVNDLARNERQRDFLIDMLGKLSDFSSPQALAGTARAVAPHVTVDSELSLVSAVDMAWTLRGIGEGDVVELEIPVVDHRTEDGAAVLLPSASIREIVAGFLVPETAGEQDTVLGS